MASNETTLAAFYHGWETYQGYLTKAITPLSPEQLALRAGPDLRSIGSLVQHVVAVRVRWFHQVAGAGSDACMPLSTWDHQEAPARTASELVEGLKTSWQLIETALVQWSPDDLAQPFQRSRGGQEFTFTRQWIVWHVIEHDLHHGGEISFSLGMHDLPGLDV